MNKSSTIEVAPRMFNCDQLRAYTGLGRNKAHELAEKIGAVKKVGSRVLYDRKVIDEYFDGSSTQTEEE